MSSIVHAYLEVLSNLAHQELEGELIALLILANFVGYNGAKALGLLETTSREKSEELNWKPNYYSGAYGRCKFVITKRKEAKPRTPPP
jgi:hypothetical protein